MSNGLNLEDKIDSNLTEIVQAKWEKLMTETGAAKLAIPIEYFAVMRIYFQLAYQEGQADMLEAMKEVYENNPDLFEHMFDDDFVSEDDTEENGNLN